MVQLTDSGVETILLGSNVLAGQRPQAIVPANVWQALHLENSEGFSLLGCTVAPGFDFADFEMGRRDDLLQAFGRHADIIHKLTRPED